jgi:UDP-perosamine 4-acetyltransferase
MKFPSETSLRLVILGAGGHASVLYALAKAAGHEIMGICDPELAKNGTKIWQGIPVLGDDASISGMNKAEIGLINGIGQMVGSQSRQTIYERMKISGFTFPVLCHPAAWVADNVKLGEGVQIMAGAVIQPGCVIGENSIINTHASIDHDCIIGSNVHVAPGATLCGSVCVGDGSFIGAGCTVVQNITIGRDAIAGAGSVVVRDMENCTKLIGVAMRGPTPGKSL